jgi:HSP20 family protein
MDLPIRRRDDDRRPEQEFEQLRGAFVDQIEQWPDFVRSFTRALDDVVPLTDIEETDDQYLLEVEMPGVRREDIDLQVDQGHLRLTGERRRRERVGLLRHRTRTTGRFTLDVRLPAPVDSDAVSASLDKGVLTVVIPKAEQSRRRRIPISCHS